MAQATNLSIHPFVHPFIHHHCTHLFTQEVNLSIDAAWSCLPNILNIHIVGTKHAHWRSTHSPAYPLSEKFLRFSLWSTVEQKFNPLRPVRQVEDYHDYVHSTTHTHNEIGTETWTTMTELYLLLNQRVFVGPIEVR